MEYSFSVVTINPLGEIVAVDESFVHVFGYKSDELIGNPLDLLFGTAHQGNIKQWLMAPGQKRQIEAQHKDNSLFPVELTLSEIPTGTGIKVLIAAFQKLDPSVDVARKRKNSVVRFPTAEAIGHERDSESDMVKRRRLSIVEFRDIELQIGPYALRDLIAASAKSRVYTATHNDSKDLVVVKMVENSTLGTGERLKREYEIGKKLNHPNIPKYYDLIETDAEVCLFLEYCGQETLETYTKKKTKLTEDEAKHFFKQIVDAVHYCHKENVFHGDIKLSNILVFKGAIKLIDFDSSKSSHNGERTTFCGTMAYMAPEMVLNASYSGQTADMWGLGVCLYVMVTGLYPFSSLADTIAGVVNPPPPDFLSEGCRDLILRILQVDTAKRLSCTEILAHEWMTQGKS